MSDDIIGIGCDWGTTNLRLYKLSNNGKVIEKRALPAGIINIKESSFENTFVRALEGWLDNYSDVPIIISGMIGSRQGWKETPYLPCPANVEKITDALVPIELKNGRRIWLTPGLSYTNNQGIPDVMRGEEVQILGALTIMSSDKITACLPGSHSKWATVIKGEVLKFSTYITGELFQTIKAHTIIGTMIDPKSWDDNAFIEGIDHSSSSRNILHQLFSVRSRGLFNQLTPATAGAFLSGLLVGHELMEALVDASSDKICLIGQGRLTNLYEKAILHKGFKPQVIDPDIIANGHFKLIEKVKRYK